jgi:hypothetical protein
VVTLWAGIAAVYFLLRLNLLPIPFVRFFQPRQDFKECRFAGAVRADQARAFVFKKPKREAFKQRSRRKTLR